MTRMPNIFTGEMEMTEGNALRHYISKGKKALKTGDYETMQAVRNEACKYISSESCFLCNHDDIGLCDFRNYNKSKLSEEEIFKQYCFPSVIRLWESDLQDILEKREKITINHHK